ncbi:hypothetical protein BV20DRAFT_984199, partial [Pilatotrama ljubarskyi]
MYKWLNYQLNTVTKRRCQQSEEGQTPQPIAVVPLPKPRKERARSGFEMFQKAAPREPSEGRFPLAQFRKACEEAWAKLAPDEQADYNDKARRFNEELEHAAARGTTPSAGSPAGLPAEAVATWLDRTFDALHEHLQWGGLFVVGGADCDGEPVYYIDGRGTNRHGQTFLDAFCALIHWTREEFERIVALWIEQCRVEPESTSEDAAFASKARNILSTMRAGVNVSCGHTSVMSKPSQHVNAQPLTPRKQSVPSSSTSTSNTPESASWSGLPSER